jgi:predicted RNA-binding Zn ribbon-like protein
MRIAASEVPHHLDLVIDFVNTLDPDEATDALATPDELAAWLSAHQLPDGGARLGEARLSDADRRSALSDADQRSAVRLREALRSLMLENNGVPADEAAARELELAARRGQLEVHFGPGGSVAIGAATTGVSGALAALLVPVADAMRDGSWQRVKACRAPDCQWAFYDRSRNRSGVWCEMAVCGNRTKVRAYRARTPR